MLARIRKLRQRCTRWEGARRVRKDLVLIASLILAMGCSQPHSPKVTVIKSEAERSASTTRNSEKLDQQVLGAWEFDPNAVTFQGVKLSSKEIPEAVRQQAKEIIAPMNGFTIYLYNDSTWKNSRSGIGSRGTWKAEGDEIVIAPPPTKPDAPSFRGRLVGKHLVLYAMGLEFGLIRKSHGGPGGH